MTSGNPFQMYAQQHPGDPYALPGYQAPMPGGLGMQGAAPAAPSIDFSKFDLSKPADQKKMLTALQGMYTQQQQAGAPGPSDAMQGDPRFAQLGQPGVNGVLNVYDPNGGSNSS